MPNQADTGDFSYYSAAFTASNACSKSARIEIAEISAICDRIESAYQVDMFVLTSQDVPSGQTTAYADDYFDYNGLGMGDDRAGMLYLIEIGRASCRERV